MPVQKQVTSPELPSDDTKYVPPPNAYPDRTPCADVQAPADLLSALLKQQLTTPQRPQQKVPAPVVTPAPAVPSPSSAPTTPPQIGQPTLTREKQLYVYAGLLELGNIIWVLDGTFTVLGLITTVLPTTIVGIGFALPIHLLFSWGQHTLTRNPHRGIRLIGIVFFLINAIANIAGLVLGLRLLAPQIAGSLPAAPQEWIAPILMWLGGWAKALVTSQPSTTPIPVWFFTTLTVILAAGLLAWFAEPLRDFFKQQWRAAYAQAKSVPA